MEIGTQRTWPLSTRHTTKWGDEGDVDIFVWDSTRKQREYLNVRDDADHDAIYYAHAYKY